MTKEEIEEEAGILDLACAQLGQELAQGRLRAAKEVHRKLASILRRLERLETAAQPTPDTAPPEAFCRDPHLPRRQAGAGAVKLEERKSNASS